jgi:hypothetical protein
LGRTNSIANNTDSKAQSKDRVAPELRDLVAAYRVVIT